jgi:hypothetical protein
MERGQPGGPRAASGAGSGVAIAVAWHKKEVAGMARSYRR